MSEDEADDPGLRGRLRRLSSIQQRFEESSAGQAVISAFVVIVVAAGVLFNLPDSPIKRSLSPIVGPIAAATYVNQQWALFAPEVPTRAETLEVEVTMADGSVRTWIFHPASRLTEAFTWVRWKRLTTLAVTKPELRPGLAQWVVHRVTGPSEQPVRVAMVLRVQNLPAPGQDARGATATKVLYEAELAGRR